VKRHRLPPSDLADPEHARRLRVWLNQWVRRIGYPGTRDDGFADFLATWWNGFKDASPPEDKRLAVLSGADLQAVSSAYGDLRIRPAVISKPAGAAGWEPPPLETAVFRPPLYTVTAWDKAISIRTGEGRDQMAFLSHLTVCRGWAVSLEAEGVEVGLEPTMIGPRLGRPASSEAKLIGETQVTRNACTPLACWMAGHDPA
jgi:hypothetical protein